MDKRTRQNRPPRIVFNLDLGPMTVYRFPVPITEQQCLRPVTQLAGTAVDVVSVTVGDGPPALYSWRGAEYGEPFGEDVKRPR